MMPTPRLLRASTAVLGALLVSAARADTFGTGLNQFTINFVTIGDAGNPVDTGTTGSYFSSYGAVGYTFQMGTYEISEDMINKANTLGGLRITKDTRTSVNQAATNVSWNEAARFVNWLNTSQGYSVAYKFTLNPGDAGYTSTNIDFANLVLWTPSDAGYDASNLYRNSAAHYFLPSEDEWYKAAYYSGSGTTYYDYPTGSDTIPTAVASGMGAGTAVYNGVASAPADITQAGGLSHYGTMGQGGNVNEWQESAFTAPNDVTSENRAAHGGSWSIGEITMRPDVRYETGPAANFTTRGFRVASVPEPTASMLMIGSGVMLGLRRRRSVAL